MSKLTDTLRQFTPRAAAENAVSHVFLLAGVLYGQLPYLVLLAMLSLELLLMSLLTIPFYPRHGVVRHLFEMIKLTFSLCFVLFFAVVTYGVAAGGEKSPAIDLLVDAWQSLEPSSVVWSVAYLVGALVFAFWRTQRSADPRLTWSKTQLGIGGTTFLAMFFMVFIAVFAGQPLRRGLAAIGLPADADVVLAVCLVLVRYFFAMVMSTFSDSDWRELAAQPYVSAATSRTPSRGRESGRERRR